MKWYKFALTLVITVGLVLALNTRFGDIPALGSFLSPVKGFWQSGNPQPEPSTNWIFESSMSDSVLVVYDERMVPHIFATNEYDLYFVQGLVTARDRMWQMDIQTRSAAGRLSEIFGERALRSDLYQRRVGMVYGAEQKLSAYESEPEIMRALNAYSAGVNHYINTTKERKLPIEYKLFDHRPELWTPFKSVLMQMNLSQTLSGRTSSVAFTNTAKNFGRTFIDQLFPYHPEWTEPIIPRGTEWDFEPISPYEKPNLSFIPSEPFLFELETSNPGVGSNSWSLAGEKTVTGAPLLANDPHLNTTLPSIWYEIQLHTPSQNVYGVSLPGAPFVLIGYNEHIAWGSTNSGASLLDVFEIEFRDESRSEYLHDGVWKATNTRIEEIHVRGGDTITEEIVFTHHGPVPHTETSEHKRPTIPVGHAIQWTGHQPSKELKSFYLINKSENWEDFQNAGRYFEGAPQNFNYADRKGNIGIVHTGKFPIRWKGMGDFISDGRDPAYDWHNYIPYEHLPKSVNPDRGFVSSANQHPVDETYPYYLGRFFAQFERGKRINDVLSEDRLFSYRDMMSLHMDNKSLRASTALPVLFDIIESRQNDLVRTDLLELLEKWDFFMEAERMEPVIFNQWWNKIMTTIWYDYMGSNANGLLEFPNSQETIRLIIQNPNSHYFTRIIGDRTLNLTDLVVQSWNDSIEELMEEELNENEWLWYRFNNSTINHLSNIEPFSHSRIKTSGAREAVNAISGSHAPSWRMVVSLEDEVRAWGVYPGGQSGNPGSKQYDSFIKPWSKGEYFELNFFRNKQEAVGYIQMLK